MYGELLKNFGLGMFVNGSFAITSGDISIKAIYITVASALVMALGI